MKSKLHWLNHSPVVFPPKIINNIPMDHSSQAATFADAINDTFSQMGFMPHGHCYLWKPTLVATHVTSDGLIGLAYLAISLTLYFLVKKIQLPFNKVVLCFGVFIGACGITHFMEIWNLWHADYWWSALVKVITAFASVSTAVYLYRLREGIFQFAEAAKLAEQRRLDLEALAQELEHRVEERTQNLAESEEQFKSLANSIPQLAWVATSIGDIYWFNKRWYAYTGADRSTNDGFNWRKFHDPTEVEKTLTVWNQAILKGDSFQMEFPLKNSNGKYRWFLMQVEPVKNSKGEVTRWFGTHTDIDEQKVIRQNLLISIQERDEFISIASHEMKTPLTSIKMQIDMVKHSMEKSHYEVVDSDKLERMFDVSSRQVDRLSRLIEDMLDASRTSVGKLFVRREKMNLNELIQNVVERLSPQFEKSNNQVTIFSEENIIGYWDNFRLEQVIINILLNAIKYATGTKIEITLTKKNDSAEIIIRDYGMGISKEMQLKIFNRFERAISANNISGLGLGLYISKEIIDRHNGSIEVESEIDQGAAFIITLPLEERS